MPPHRMQEWFAFALFGVALMLTGLMPALPAAADAQYVAFGVMLVYTAAVGLFMTSQFVLDALETVESRLTGA